MCVFSRYKHELVEIPALTLPIPEVLPEGVIVGWRKWDFWSSNGLKSPNQGTIWTADNPLRSHRIDQDNSGIYAYASEAGCWDSYGGGISGEVALWGKVYRHLNSDGKVMGYTGQYAYPLSLFLSSRTLALAFENSYGKQGTYINYHAPTVEGADAKGYIALV